MSIRIGLYEFFAYTIPGVFYLLIAGFATSVFGWLPITWSTLDDLSLTSLVLLTGAGYVTGYLMDFFGYKWARLFRPKSTAQIALRVFEKYHPQIETDFTSDDWGILMHSLKQLSGDAAADIEQLNATSMMMRNLAFGFILLALVFILYFALVSNAVGNLILGATCLALSALAVRISAKFRLWFYLGVYEAMAAQKLTDAPWFRYKNVTGPDMVGTDSIGEGASTHIVSPSTVTPNSSSPA